MTLTTPARETIDMILAPVRSGRKSLISRKRVALGDEAFVAALLAEASRLTLSAMEIHGWIVIFRPGSARWLLHPDTIEPITSA